jgi:hypothetical protein
MLLRFFVLDAKFKTQGIQPSSETPDTNRRRHGSRKTRMDGRVPIWGGSFH